MSDPKIELAAMRVEMLKKLRETQTAAHQYFCACELGSEREQAGELYDRLMNVTRSL